MDILKLILESENLVFTIALLLMFAIAVIEGVASLLGAGLSQFIDGLIPEVDVDLDVDVDIDAPEVTISPMSKFLAWLDFGKVPALIIIVVFLTVFGLLGLVIQSMVYGALGNFIPGLVASIITFVGSIPLSKSITSLLAKILPKDETDAVPEQSFVGRTAKITLGSARYGYPAQAKLKDRNGSIQYVMIEPDSKDEVLNQNDYVLIVRKDGAVFYGEQVQGGFFED